MLRMNRKSACLSAASVIALSICISTESYARSTLPPLGATVNSYGANSVFDTIKVRGFEVPIYLDGLRLPVDPGTTFAPSLPNLFGQLNANNLTNKYYVSNCSGPIYCALGNARTVLGTLRYHFQPG